ncbi:MAG: hypothetical protein HKN29_10760 [Rhodothermales bacterium]|nr:hypothetical protein [Rhodothermales bacterium]
MPAWFLKHVSTMPTITEKRRRLQRAAPNLEDLFEDLESVDGADREELLYERASYELESGRKRRGVYAMALTRVDGDRNRADARYMQHRVDQLQSEFETWNLERQEAEAELERREEASADLFRTVFALVILILAVMALVSWS